MLDPADYSNTKTLLSGSSGLNSEAMSGVFSVANIIGNLLFSGIGFVAFVYGRKMSQLRPVLFGIALMAFPYFFSTTWQLYAIGVGLTAALWVFRDAPAW